MKKNKKTIKQHKYRRGAAYVLHKGTKVFRNLKKRANKLACRKNKEDWIMDIEPYKPKDEPQEIRLNPSMTDYKTYVDRTSRALNETGPVSRKTKPNLLFLSLSEVEPQL